MVRLLGVLRSSVNPIGQPGKQLSKVPSFVAWKRRLWAVEGAKVSEDAEAAVLGDQEEMERERLQWRAGERPHHADFEAPDGPGSISLCTRRG